MKNAKKINETQLKKTKAQTLNTWIQKSVQKNKKQINKFPKFKIKKKNKTKQKIPKVH